MARVVSICPSNTELMEYLCMADELVGVDDFSDWPKRVDNLPRLGPDLSINMDLVVELKPDLVLASLSVPGMEKNVAALKERNIPHIVLNPQSFQDIEEDLIRTASALSQRAKGLEAAAKFRERLENIKEKGKKMKNKPNLYWEWWPKPIFTPGKINWLTELSEAAGARNIYSDVNLASVQTEWSDVIERNPDVICLAWVGVRKQKINKNIVKNRPGFQSMNIDDHQIFILEEELYCRPSPRLLDGLEKLFKLIHSSV